MSSTLTDTRIPIWTVAERLVKAREFCGLDQRQMAAAIGKGIRSISRYETSDAPPAAIVHAYASATGVPAWWIFGEDDPGDVALDRRARRRAVTQREWPSRTLDWYPAAA